MISQSDYLIPRTTIIFSLRPKNSTSGIFHLHYPHYSLPIFPDEVPIFTIRLNFFIILHIRPLLAGNVDFWEIWSIYETPEEVKRRSEQITFDRPDFATSMYEVEILRERTQVFLVEIHTIFGTIEKSIFELCPEMFRDKPLDYLPLPFGRWLHDEIFLSLGREDRIQNPPVYDHPPWQGGYF